MWPAIGNAEMLAIEIRGQRRMLTSDDVLELGMKTAETQTELIDGSSPSSANDHPSEFQVVDEVTSLPNNNNEAKLNINSTNDIKHLRCIDDDDLSGHRVLFPPDSPETKL